MRSIFPLHWALCAVLVVVGIGSTAVEYSIAKDDESITPTVSASCVVDHYDHNSDGRIWAKVSCPGIKDLVSISSVDSVIALAQGHTSIKCDEGVGGITGTMHRVCTVE